MSFQGDLDAFAKKVEARGPQIVDRSAEYVFGSITEGSQLTSAPGQPVDTGHLKGSWQNVPEGPTTRAILTNVAYAPVIEEASRAFYDEMGDPGPPKAPVSAGGRPSIKSMVGGNHSVKLTRASWPRIVDAVVREFLA